MHHRIAKQTTKRDILVQKQKEEQQKQAKLEAKKKQEQSRRELEERNREKEKEMAKTEKYFESKDKETSGLIANLKSTYESSKSKFYTLSASAMNVLLNFQCKTIN